MMLDKHEISACHWPTTMVKSNLNQEKKVAASVCVRKAMGFLLWTWRLYKCGCFCGFHSAVMFGFVLSFFFKLEPSLYVELHDDDDDDGSSPSGSAVKLHETSRSSHVKWGRHPWWCFWGHWVLSFQGSWDFSCSILFGGISTAVRKCPVGSVFPMGNPP